MARIEGQRGLEVRPSFRRPAELGQDDGKRPFHVEIGVEIGVAGRSRAQDLERLVAPAEPSQGLAQDTSDRAVAELQALPEAQEGTLQIALLDQGRAPGRHELGAVAFDGIEARSPVDGAAGEAQRRGGDQDRAHAAARRGEELEEPGPGEQDERRRRRQPVARRVVEDDAGRERQQREHLVGKAPLPVAGGAQRRRAGERQDPGERQRGQGRQGREPGLALESREERLAVVPRGERPPHLARQERRRLGGLRGPVAEAPAEEVAIGLDPADLAAELRAGQLERVDVLPHLEWRHAVDEVVGPAGARRVAVGEGHAALGADEDQLSRGERVVDRRGRQAGERAREQRHGLAASQGHPRPERQGRGSPEQRGLGQDGEAERASGPGGTGAPRRLGQAAELVERERHGRELHARVGQARRHLRGVGEQEESSGGTSPRHGPHPRAATRPTSPSESACSSAWQA